MLHYAVSRGGLDWQGNDFLFKAKGISISAYPFL